MKDTIWVILRGKGVQKGIEVTARAAGVYPWRDSFCGVLSGLTQDEEFAFLEQNCVVEATYNAHRYWLRLVEREGRFEAWLAVMPEPTWPTELRVPEIGSRT
jgi:hypothetical protein